MILKSSFTVLEFKKIYNYDLWITPTITRMHMVAKKISSREMTARLARQMSWNYVTDNVNSKRLTKLYPQVKLPDPRIRQDSRFPREYLQETWVLFFLLSHNVRA